MMGLILLLIIGFLVSFLILPYWWWLFCVPFVICLVAARSHKQALFSSAVVAGLLWFGYSLCLYISSAALIARRVATMFSLPSSFWLILITGLLAAIVAGAAGWTGYSLRTLLSSK